MRWKMVFPGVATRHAQMKQEELTKRAETSGVRTMVGLCHRYIVLSYTTKDPVISEGYIEVLGTTLVGSGYGWTGVTDSLSHVYDNSNGVTLSVPPCILWRPSTLLYFIVRTKSNVNRSLSSGHEYYNSLYLTQPCIDLGTLNERHGCVCLFIAAATSRGVNMRWEINGTKGDLLVTAPSAYIPS